MPKKRTTAKPKVAVEVGDEITVHRDGKPHVGTVSKINPDHTLSLRMETPEGVRFLHRVNAREIVTE